MEVADLSGGQYSVNEKKDTEKEDQAFVTRIIVEFTNGANERNKNLTFKNNVPFRSCI